MLILSYYASSNILGAFGVFIHLILIRTIWGRYYQFTDEETDIKETVDEGFEDRWSDTRVHAHNHDVTLPTYTTHLWEINEI